MTTSYRESEMLGAAMPGRIVSKLEPLAGGLRNGMFRVEIAGMAEPLVLRVYAHDRTMCQKELDLFALVRKTVPVPEVLHAMPEGMDGGPPFVLFRFVRGITFEELRKRGDVRAIAECAASIGEALAAIGEHRFANGGWLGPGPTPTSPLLEGSDPCPRFVDECLESLVCRSRMGPELRDAVHALIWKHARALAAVDDEGARLVHCDFGKRNIVVAEEKGRWSVAAILDWEFAVAATPLIDVGHFLRYEHGRESLVAEPFVRAFEVSGGKLPSGWRDVSRLLDLTALVELLGHESLPNEIVAEVVGLVDMTVRHVA